MAEVPVESLKVGDEIKLEGTYFKIITFEKSNLGKQGKAKCRIEAEKNGEKKIIIRLANDTLEKK